MAEAYDITDDELGKELNAIITALETGNMSCHLFQNDYTPVPGSSIGDYEECDFPGYAFVSFDPADFSTAAVIGHVAIVTLTYALAFNADSSGFTDQTIYGYYVLDADDNYVWGIRFDTVRTIHPSDLFEVTPQRKHKTC